LVHVYKLKSKNEKDPVAKVIYQKLRDDSSSHMALLTEALKIVGKKMGKKIPNPIVIKVMDLDPLTMKKEETSINEVDTTLEEMEAASAALFALFAKSFSDPHFSRFFRAMEVIESHKSL